MKMRHTIVFLLLLIGNLSPSNAEKPFKKEWAAGVSGGATLAFVSFSPKVHQGIQQGYHAGVMVRWITEKNLGLQLECNLVQQGWNEEFYIPEDYPDPKAFPDYHYSRQMNYVEVPFLTHIYFGGKHVRFFFNLGPQIGYLLKESSKERLYNAQPNKSNDQHFLPANKRLEWGLMGGPGVELRTKVGFVLLEARYYYSLSDIYTTRRQDPFTKAAPQVIFAKMTYLLPFR